jgi:hypothetical protein
MPDSQDLVRGASEKHMTYDELFVPWKISLLIYLFIFWHSWGLNLGPHACFTT